jgi:DNA replication protein DnaC
MLLEVISRAYEHHRLMLTTNLAFEEWTEIFGSERLICALLGRLTHQCQILGRLRQARKRFITARPNSERKGQET